MTGSMSATWRFFSTLTSVINRIVILGIAAVVVSDLLTQDELVTIERGLELVGSHKDVTIAIGVVLVVLNLNLVQFGLFCLQNTSSSSYIHSRTVGGNSRVALTAVKKALKSTARQVPEISRSKIQVERLGRNRYRVHIRYWVADVIHAGSAAEHLRLVLKKRFSELVVLDPKDRVEFDLDLAGIVSRTTLAKKKLAAPAEKAFKGPVYPVDSPS